MSDVVALLLQIIHRVARECPLQSRVEGFSNLLNLCLKILKPIGLVLDGVLGLRHERHEDIFDVDLGLWRWLLEETLLLREALKRHSC